MPAFACPQCSSPCEASHNFCPLCGFPVGEVQPSENDPLIGQTLPGGYVLLELVGIGGMGRVYRAEQKNLGRTVAVKIIHPHLLGEESAAARFITEARASSRLNHPNSVAVIDFGKNEGQLYLVMEFLRGKDLARVLFEEGPLPFARIVDILCQTLAALGEAHHFEIIHRDLKPENIVLEPMRTGGDFVKVVDFGLAKMRAEVSGSNITNPGIVCGTPDYMAPEQGRGDPIDARSDLYACGVILYQLLTGRLPFETDSPTQAVLMHMTNAVPDPNVVAPDREIPDALVEIVYKALEKDPASRFQSAEEFAQALRVAGTELDAPSARISVDFGAICAECRTLVPRGQKFCGECGTRVGMMSVSPERSTTSSRPERSSRLPRLPLPFSSRSDDVEWLNACRFEVFDSVATARIVGEAGSGKTRLVREFLALCRGEGDVVIECRPDPWSAGVAYYTVADCIRKLASLPEDGADPSTWTFATAEARRGLLEVLGGGGNSSEPKRHLWARAPRRGDLDRGAAVAEALRWALARAQLAARNQRVVLVIDDLHAVDALSQRAFFDIALDPPKVPILMIATHLSEFASGWPGASRTLVGLPTSVAAALLKGAPPPHSIHPEDRTLLPLYVEQLLRFNLEGGSKPPARLGDLVALRVERLPQDARRVLQALCVLGDRSNMGMLERLLPEVTSVELAIAALVDAGFVEETRGGLTTSHPLFRSIALASTPAEVKRDLHKSALRHAEDAPLEMRALHAYYASCSFEALMLLENVADRAEAAGDTNGAVLALRRGIELSRHELVRGELDDPMNALLIFSRKLGEVLARAGDLADSEGALREALDLAAKDGMERAEVLASLSHVARERGRNEDAERYFKQAYELAERAGSRELLRGLEDLRREWLLRTA